MASNTLPTASAVQVELGPAYYDLAQLWRAVRDCVAKPNKVDAPQNISPHLFHLHTLTIQATPPPITRMVQYPDGPRENPDAAVFDGIVEKLQGATGPCEPIMLSQPDSGMLRLPPFDEKKAGGLKQALAGRSGQVFLPTSGAKKPLVTLQTLPIANNEFYISTSAWDLLSWVHAALALDPAQAVTRRGVYRDDKERIHMRTGVDVMWVPGPTDEDPPEIKLVIKIVVYLDMVAIETPLPEVGNDLMALILVSLLPTETTKGDGESFIEARAAALRQFYEALRPAPDIPVGFDARRLQPKALVSRLLPFQKRTVALLLEHEGAPLAGNEIHQRTVINQWTKLHFEGFGDYAFHRLTAKLQKIKSDTKGKGRDADGQSDMDGLSHVFHLGDVRGTMLCEEMGLGKTVEAIALMLLHRHPLSIPRPPSIAEVEAPQSSDIDLRTRPADYDLPEMKAWLEREHAAFDGTTSWSEESQLDVAEVAATLVVTPLPLLKQWVTEMAAHAPGLRVGVYPGWKVLISQVECERRAKAKAKAKEAAKALKRKNATFRNRTRTKYSRGMAGERVLKLEEVSDDDGDDDVSDDDDRNYDMDLHKYMPPPVPVDTLLDLVQRAWLENVRGLDVVITTYQTLADDLTVAHPAPIRRRRSTAKYNIEERPRSPLVMVEWFRVIMDEVQLQGDASAAAEMVSLIPRKCSLAMSGTPARNDVRDLVGSLRFLRVPHVTRPLWHRLLLPENRSTFRALFRALAVRTTKVEVAGEFNLPHQTRFVVTITLSDVEFAYYQDTLERQRDRLRPNDRQAFDRAVFYTSMRHLRQICTHIQVGALQRGVHNPVDRADRIQLGRNLMNMDEALQKMREDNDSTLISQSRTQMRQMILKAQLLVLDDQEDLRNMKALALYERVRTQGEKILVPAHAQLDKLIGDREDSVDDEVALRSASQAERTHARKMLWARAAIRETLLLIHQSWFLEGDVRHVQKEEDQEVVAYKMAEDIRKDILLRPLKQAYKSVDAMAKTTDENPAIETMASLMSSTKFRGGITTHDAVAEANSLLSILNDNAALVYNWRDKVIKLLQQPLEAQEDAVPAAGEGQDVQNPDEEYYAEALKAQGDVEAYLTAYAAAIADRKEFLLEQRTTLAVHEGSIKKKRVTNRAREAELDAAPEELSDVDDLTLKLMRERQAFRDKRDEEECVRPLKAVMVQISNVVHSSMRPEEVALAKVTSTALRKFINDQTQIVEKLNKELEVLRATFNKRVLYFASLQEISDSVAAPEFRDFRKDMAEADRQITQLEIEIARTTVKGRYLQYLDNDKPDGHKDCAICFGTSDDKFAMMLGCGHLFCVACFREYRKLQYIGRKCATCKAVINTRELMRIPLNRAGDEGEGGSGAMDEDEEEEAEEQGGAEDELAHAARQADIDMLNMMPDSRQRGIATIDMMGEYGSKINFLIKHLLYYRLTEPGTRHVVFSNWADSLHIVEQALRENAIKFVSFESNTKRNDVVEQFHADPSITVFLLHAERESAGLTLTSCGVVHLLEPVLQHSFELQAIGRVDRLGQTRETTVYCYATTETVESRILSQGVRSGTSIYLADADADARAVDAMPNVASAAGRGGDLLTLNADDAAQMLSLIM